MSQREIDPVGFAEKTLSLLELGSFSATYKYALFTAIMDLCLESATRSGTNDTVITTRQLAERVVELYWQHATPYEGGPVLRQGGVRTVNQAEILRAISDFRALYAGEAGVSPFRARLAHPDAFEVAAYQRGAASTFDNRLLLKPGVAEAVKAVVGILRPLVLISAPPT